MRAHKYRSDIKEIVQGNINAVLLLLLLMELAVKEASCQSVSSCSHYPDPLGSHRPERSSNGNRDRAERAWAKPNAETLAHDACVSVLFSCCP